MARKRKEAEVREKEATQEEEEEVKRAKKKQKKHKKKKKEKKVKKNKVVGAPCLPDDPNLLNIILDYALYAQADQVQLPPPMPRGCFFLRSDWRELRRACSSCWTTRCVR
jgi:spore cortex formation protein SpoVR/YcgB (stage V sporulation)